MKEIVRLVVIFLGFLAGSVFGGMIGSIVCGVGAFFAIIFVQERLLSNGSWDGMWVRHRAETVCFFLVIAFIVVLNLIYAGFWAIVVGIAAGQYLGEKITIKLGWAGQSLQNTVEFSNAYIAILASAANADGGVSEKERNLVRSLAAELFEGVAGDSEIAQLAEQHLGNPPGAVDAGAYTAQLGPELASYLQKDLCVVLFADGEMAPAELAWLEHFQSAARLSDWDILTAFSRNLGDDKAKRMQYLSVLGLNADANVDAIRKAYRELAMQYHPDRQDAVAPHLRDLIAGKMASINEANAYLTKGADTEVLFFQNPQGRTYTPEAGGVFDCKCWLCGQMLRVPGNALHPSVRCSKCYALAGFGFDPHANGRPEGAIFPSIVDALKSMKPAPKQLWHKHLATGVLAVVALTLWGVAGGTRQGNTEVPAQPTHPHESAYDAAMATGDKCTAEKNYNQAIAGYTAAIKFKPDSDAAHGKRGKVRELMQESDLALADYSEAVRIAPRKPEYHYALGEIWFFKASFEVALLHFDRAVELNPNYVKAREKRVAIRLLQGDRDKALADLNEILRIDSNHLLALLFRIEIWQKKKQYANAVADMRVAIRIDPNEAEHYRSLSWLLATCSDPTCRDGKEAVRMAKLAIEKAGKDVTYDHYGIKAAAHAEAGEFNEAMVAQMQAIRMIKRVKDADPQSVVEYEKVLMFYSKRLPLRQPP